VFHTEILTVRDGNTASVFETTWVPRKKCWLYSEAVREVGGKLQNRTFMANADDQPNDICVVESREMNGARRVVE
jgi:hypothetical protein